MSTPNQRQPNETQQQYRERLKAGKAIEKQAKQGRMLWPAYKGTYIRAKHGDLV